MVDASRGVNPAELVKHNFMVSLPKHAVTLRRDGRHINLAARVYLCIVKYVVRNIYIYM